MKVFLLQNVEKLGMRGEIITVSFGYAQNFLFPRRLALEVTGDNKKHFERSLKIVEQRQEVIASKTSMLAERVKSLKLVIKGKAHDYDAVSKSAKLYGAVGPAEIAQALAEHGVAVAKSQIELDKAIKATGVYTVTVKLSNKLRPQLNVKVVAE